jgi:hypothetical protein
MLGHIAIGKKEVKKMDRMMKNARKLGMPEKELELRHKQKSMKRDIETREREGEHMLQEGYGKAPKRTINFGKIHWGALTKSFNAYKRKHPEVSDIHEYAMLVINNPEDFPKTTEKRARFYHNILMKGKGKGDVVMSRKDYVGEHKHLIGLLNKIAGLASKEASKQSAEPQLKGGAFSPEEAQRRYEKYLRDIDEAYRNRAYDNAREEQNNLIRFLQEMEEQHGWRPERAPVGRTNANVPPPTPDLSDDDYESTESATARGQGRRKRCVNGVMGGCGKCGGV